MSDLVPVRRALLSVSDKTGLADFARALHEQFKVELLSTGGTARFLRDLGLPVTDVSDVTGFPEMMDGRVKTLHPKIHGGLLALRDNPEHVAAMEKHGIRPIDLVCINLYPFEQTITKPGVTFEEAIENIDIGGPSMIRSAAKNHRFVLVVTSPDRYEKVLGDLRQHNGSSCGTHRLKQAQRAFNHTAQYDALIAGYLAGQITAKESAEPEKAQPGATGGGPARFLTDPRHGSVATATEDAPDRPSGAPRSFTVEKLLNPSSDFRTFINDLLVSQAVSVTGTEAAAFRVTPDGRNDLELLVHIRPDQSPPEKRAEAVAAFRDIIKPCLAQDRDGAIELAYTSEGKDAQYCLVTLLRNGKAPEVVSAVICRCRDRAEARVRLDRVQVIGGYFEVFALRHPDKASRGLDSDGLPDQFVLQLHKKMDLRYGENPHQKAALYVGPRPDEASVAFATQHHGKELSYINLLDADAALSAVKELGTPAACIVKHATPCGFATAADLPTAFRKAFEGDPLAAFGGIVALNRPIDLAAAQAITSIDKLLEVIVAPSYDADALDLLKTRWKNVRLLEVGPVEAFHLAAADGRAHDADHREMHLHKIVGGYLVQERDLGQIDPSSLKLVSKRKPTEKEWADLTVAWLACKHVKSNAIVIARDGMMLGSGAGQQDRVNACRIAVAKASAGTSGAERVKGAVAASDAFFPFPDGPRILLEAGVTAIIHPGGSVKDQETIDLVDQFGAAMALTGQRHFKH